MTGGGGRLRVEIRYMGEQMKNKNGKIIVMLLLALVLCFVGVFEVKCSVYAVPLDSQVDPNPSFSQNTNGGGGGDQSKPTPITVTVTIKYDKIDWTVAGYKDFDTYYATELKAKEGNFAGTDTSKQEKGTNTVTITTQANTGTIYQNAFNYYAYIPSYYTAKVENAEEKVATGTTTITINFERTGVLTPEETENTDWYKGIVNPVISGLNTALWVVIAVVLTAGMVYAVYLGVQLARADSEDKRADAKKRMLWFILAFVLTTLVLVLVNLFIAKGDIVTRLFN